MQYDIARDPVMAGMYMDLYDTYEKGRRMDYEISVAAAFNSYISGNGDLGHLMNVYTAGSFDDFDNWLGNFVSDAVMNTSARKEAAYEFKNADWRSPLGIATGITAGISWTANTADMVANFIPIVGPIKGTAEAGIKTGIKDVVKIFSKDVTEKLVAETEGKQIEKALAEDVSKIGPYRELSKDTSIPGQAHHLNQDAAFRDVIPSGEGASTKLEGNAFTEVDSPHYNAHESLESFWDQYRGTGIEPPSNLQYTKALADSLRAAGKSEGEVQQAVKAAIQQRVDYNLLGGEAVPRIPGSINQKAR
jgi:hypothetical protein